MSDLVTTNPIQTIAPEPKESRVKNTIKTNTPLNLKNYWRTSDLAYNDAQYLCHPAGFDIDVAASEENSFCDFFIDENKDALKTPWFQGWCKFAWCNPPFDRKKEFLARAYDQRLDGSTCMMLPYEPCTAWWREGVDGKASVVYVPDGRYNYCHPESGEEIKGVNFASAFIVFTALKMPTQYVQFKRGISAK